MRLPLTLTCLGAFALVATAQTFDDKRAPARVEAAQALKAVPPLPEALTRVSRERQRSARTAAPQQGRSLADAFAEPTAGRPQLASRYAADPNDELGGTRRDVGESGLAAVITMDIPQRYELPAAEVLAAILPEFGLPLADPTSELDYDREDRDVSGVRHLRLQQVYKGVPVHGGAAIVHVDARGHVTATGRLQPSLKVDIDLAPAFDAAAAEALIYDHLGGRAPLEPDLQQLLPDDEAPERVIFYHDGRPRLAYVATVHPTLAERYEVIIDAHTGEVLRQTDEVCHLTHDLHRVDSSDPAVHTGALGSRDTAFAKTRDASPRPPLGPETALATDVNGVARTLQTYREGGSYYLVDGSRPMFDARSTVPTDVRGGIITLDARGTSYESDDFAAYYVASDRNRWDDPSTVSAHYNAEQSYEYFRQTFGRNAITGIGSTILSVVHVADEGGGGLDNAFWNGKAMFYGDGRDGFTDLTGGLDVGGHEMAHGVDQATSNLEYRDESGALDESFADIYGAMIDRDDWQIGETVVNPAVFRSGTMRDMADPHNGGTSLNDRGWQPAHYDERYTGTQDNGGVHINSGIPNRAFYLIATAIGKEKAEQLYYDVQTNYLTRNARFIDLRIGLQDATERLYGRDSPEWDAVVAGLDAVGIPGDTGGGGGTDEPGDQDTNPGTELIAYTDDDETYLRLADAAGALLIDDLTPQAYPKSRPSVTDDGSMAVFVTADGRLSQTAIDYRDNTVRQQLTDFDLDGDGESDLHNVAVSRDGSRIALLLDLDGERDDNIYVYDIAPDTVIGRSFRLYTPGSNGERVHTVEYADVIEFDHTGEAILYDAFTEVPTPGGGSYSTWEIGVLDVFTTRTGPNFADGEIFSVFGVQEEGTAIGNPTISKNSAHVIAVDYLNADGNYELLAIDLITGDIGNIWTASGLNWPSFTAADDKLVFSAVTTDGDPVIAGIDLQADKITAVEGTAVAIVGDAHRATAFANGSRTIVSGLTDLAAGAPWITAPNPATEAVQILRNVDAEQANGEFELFDLQGRRVLSAPAEATEIEIGGLPVGTYVLRQGTRAQTIVKQ